MMMPTLSRILLSAINAVSSRQARIQHLLRACGPTHIARLIVAVIVDSVKCQFRRWFNANVPKEGHEVFAPFVAYTNPTAAIIAILGVVWIVAPLNYRAPESAFNRVAQSVCAFLLCCDASAGVREAFPQVANKDIAFSSADASAKQVSKLSVSAWCFTKDGPMTDGCANGDRTE